MVWAFPADALELADGICTDFGFVGFGLFGCLFVGVDDGADELDANLVDDGCTDI